MEKKNKPVCERCGKKLTKTNRFWMMFHTKTNGMESINMCQTCASNLVANLVMLERISFSLVKQYANKKPIGF